mgnify:FL=1
MNSQTATITDIGYSAARALGEVFEYDRNSNILSLERVYAGEPVQDAALSYVGNRLTGVNDASMPYNKDVVPSFAAGTYALEYDGDGRLVADGTRGITDIRLKTHCAAISGPSHCPEPKPNVLG